MLGAFAALSLSTTSGCDYIIDLSASSGASSYAVSGDYGYCFRFTKPHGVFTMNDIGYAKAGIYHASNVSSAITGYSYDQAMFYSLSVASAPRSVSFGNYYGLIYVTGMKSTAIKYTYIYTSSKCSSTYLSTNSSTSYSLPPSGTSATANLTECYIYTPYGNQTVSVAKNTGITGDTMQYSYGNGNSGYIASSFSYGDVYPIELVYYVSQTGSDSRYNSTLSSVCSGITLDGTFSATSQLAYINYYSITDTQSSLVGIIIGSVVGGIALILIIAFVIWCCKSRAPKADETTIKSSLNTAVPPTPIPMTQYPQGPLSSASVIVSNQQTPLAAQQTNFVGSSPSV